MTNSLFWIDTLAYSCTTFVAVGLLIVVLGAGGRRPLNVSFALLMFAVSLWAGSSVILRWALWFRTGNPQLWMEVSTLGFALIGPLLLLFSGLYTRVRRRWPYVLAVAALVLTALLTVPLVRHQIISDVRIGPGGMVRWERTLLGEIIAAPLFGSVLTALALLWTERRRVRDHYLPIGLAILVISGVLFSFVMLPFPTLSITMIASIAFMGYAVVNRQLFNPLRELTENLRELQALNATIVQSLEGGILLQDDGGRISFVNPKLAGLLAYDVDELIDEHWESIVAPEHIAALEQATAGLSQGLANRYETVLRTKDGRQVPVIVNPRPLFEGDRFVGVLSVVTDITERKRMEEALRESEETYRTLVRTSPDAVTATDLEGSITKVSERTLELHGFAAAEEMLGKSKLELIAHEDRDRARLDLQRVLAEGIVLGAEYTMLKKDGSRFTGEMNAALITHADGSPRAFVTTVRDVTERKRAEEALRESEQKFRSLADQSPNMIFISKSDRLVYANERCEHVTGYTRQKLHSPDFGLHSLVAPKHREVVKANLEKHSRGEEVEPFECTLVTRDDRTLEAVLTTRLIDYEGETAILGTVTDVTELRRLESQVEERRLYLESVLACAPDAIVTLDAENNILDWNTGAEALFGYLREEALGRKIDTLLAGPDAGMFEEAAAFMKEVATGESIQPRETVRFRKDGTPVDVIVAASPIAVQGELFGSVAIYTDITRLKQAEKALQRRYEELALLNRSAQALISTLDLDELLATILEEVRHLLDVVACSVWLTSSDTGELVCRQATGPKADIVRGWRLGKGEGIAGWVAQNRESLIVPDVRTDPRHFNGVDRRTRLPLHSMLSVPLQVKDTVIGVLQVADSETARFDTEDLALLEPLAATAAMAIENARLYAQARRDAEAKSMLLQEVNHRVKNNLSAIIGLLYAIRRRDGMQDEPAYEFILKDLTNRLQSLITVSSLLSASEWAPLPLSELAGWVIGSCLQTLSPAYPVSVDVSPSPVRVTPDQAQDLSLVINELTTNTVKHALQGRQAATIAIRIALEDNTVLFEFRDDGPGYPEQALRMELGTIGLDLIDNIVSKNLRGKLSLHNDHGAVATVQFKPRVETGQENGV